MVCFSLDGLIESAKKEMSSLMFPKVVIGATPDEEEAAVNSARESSVSVFDRRPYEFMIWCFYNPMRIQEATDAFWAEVVSSASAALLIDGWQMTDWGRSAKQLADKNHLLIGKYPRHRFHDPDPSDRP